MYFSCWIVCDSIKSTSTTFVADALATPQLKIMMNISKSQRKCIVANSYSTDSVETQFEMIPYLIFRKFHIFLGCCIFCVHRERVLCISPCRSGDPKDFV